jgi:hypothetical protein
MNACILDRSPLQKKLRNYDKSVLDQIETKTHKATTHSIREENSQSIPCLPWIRDLRVYSYNKRCHTRSSAKPRGKNPTLRDRSNKSLFCGCVAFRQPPTSRVASLLISTWARSRSLCSRPPPGPLPGQSRSAPYIQATSEANRA